jgi:uncharacterized protein (TIGR02145 family)
MRKKLHKIALVAAFGFALALTFSCSPDDGEDNPSSGSNVGISSSSVNNGSSSSVDSSSSEMGSSSSSNGSSSSSLPSSSSQVIAPVYGDPIFDMRDDKIYPTVVIGGKTWMAKNLNYAIGGKCGNGNSLSDENTTSCDTYGRLYDWSTANSVCPTGWHLPTNAEWTTLIDAVGGSSTAATKLKAKSGWDDDLYGDSGNGTDDYGFAALPGGDGEKGSFKYYGIIGVWWTATTVTEIAGFTNFAHIKGMFNDRTDIYISVDDKTILYSVRCVKD